MGLLEILRAAFEILSFGAVVVLIVLGLGVIASMMGIFNFAQGEFVLLGAYVTYLFDSNGLPAWQGMIAAPFVVGVIGFGLEFLVIRRFYVVPTIAMLATYALGLSIREIVRGLIGGRNWSVLEPVGGSINIAGVDVSAWRLVIVVITLLVLIGSYLLLSRTTFGLRVRATLENPALARASSISTASIYGLTFAFGAALAGLAGALVVPIFSLYADMGLRFLTEGFVAVLLGGVGSFMGPVAGAAVIGTLGAGLPWVMPAVAADLLVFVLAIVFIKFRPQGLVSGKGI